MRRLQVLMEESELREVRTVARRHGLTTAEWVRQQLRTARAADSHGDTAAKLAAIRDASRFSYPVGEIDEMLAEVERGYLEPPS